MMREKTFRLSGSAGAPTFTSAPSTASSDRYASTSIGALTVFTTRSNRLASCAKVSGSEVA